MSNNLTLFRAWMGSPQGLKVSEAGMFANMTGELIEAAEIPAENKEFFFALVEGLIVSNYNHEPSPNYLGGPICTPKDAVAAALDWFDDLKLAQGLQDAAIPADAREAATESGLENIEGLG